MSGTIQKLIFACIATSDGETKTLLIGSTAPRMYLFQLILIPRISSYGIMASFQL